MRCLSGGSLHAHLHCCLQLAAPIGLSPLTLALSMTVGGGAHRPLANLCPSSPCRAYPYLLTHPFPWLCQQSSWTSRASGGGGRVGALGLTGGPGLLMGSGLCHALQGGEVPPFCGPATQPLSPNCPHQRDVHPGGRLQPVLMRHAPPAICQNLWGGGGGGGRGVGGRVGGIGSLAGGGGGATHYNHMHSSRGCLGAWGYRGMYAIIAISCLLPGRKS